MPGQLHPSQKAGGGGLHIALHSGDLPGKGDALLSPHPVIAVQQAGGVQVGVSVHHPIAHVLGVFQSWDHREHPFLLPPLQMGLEAHDVVKRAVGIVPAQLHHGIWLFPRLWVGQAPGLEGAEAQCLLPPASHYFHGHAALEHVFVFKAMDLRLLGGAQLLPESQVLLLGHGAVDIVVAASTVAGAEPGLVHVHAVKGDDRGRGIKEIQVMTGREQPGNSLGQGIRGQRAGCHDDLPLRESRHFSLHHGDVGTAADGLRYRLGKADPVHRQGAAGLHPGLVGAAQDEGAAAAQFFFQQANGVFQLVAPQGVGAHQLGKAGAVVGGGHLLGLHLPQGDGNTPPGQLPGRLAARQPGADHGHRLFCVYHGSVPSIWEYRCGQQDNLLIHHKNQLISSTF